MLSHDFARALLERRNHDLRFVAEVCYPARDDESGDICRTELADERARVVHGLGDDIEVLNYDSEHDVLDVMLGPIFAGQQGGYTLSPEEVQRLLRILSSLQLGRESLALRDRLKDAA
jgi:hypothetical protein